MATLTSSSTAGEIEAAYLDNASYEEDGSVAKARAFITACRFKIHLLADSAASPQGHQASIRTEKYQREIEAAQSFIRASADVTEGGSGAVYLGVEDYRA